jgi:hypothetical protein
MDGLIVLAVLLGIGYFFGARVEKQHFRSLQRREQAIQGLMLSTAGLKCCYPRLIRRSCLSAVWWCHRISLRPS